MDADAMVQAQSNRARCTWWALLLMCGGVFLVGCSALVSSETRRSPLSEARLQREMRQKADKDSFPTPQQAGLMTVAAENQTSKK